MEFLFRLWHLPQNKIVFCHRLVGAGRVRIGSLQHIDGLFRQQAAGPAKVVQEIRVVGPLGQRGL